MYNLQMLSADRIVGTSRAAGWRCLMSAIFYFCPVFTKSLCVDKNKWKYQVRIFTKFRPMGVTCKRTDGQACRS